MSDTGKQSPLGVNTLNSYLNAQGLTINPVFTGYVGTSHNFPGYSFGTICQNTVLRVITHAIHEGYYGNADGIPYTSVYNNLISIGGGFINTPISSITSGVDSGTNNIWFKVTYTNNVTLTPNSYVKISGVTPSGYNGNWLIESVGSDSAGTQYFRVAVTANYGTATTPGVFSVDTQVPGLGNAKALVYTWEDLIGRFGTGSFNLGDTKGWGGSTYKNNLEGPDPNPATQWAYTRLMALQAWMEFNYNSTLEVGDQLNPAGYRDFLQSFNSAAGFINYSNSAILPVDNSKTFLDGTYSNMNDLISGDITGISLATKAFGQDLIAMGKVLNLEKIATFGLPSNLLKTLAQTNALTQNISLAIIATGINTNELGEILGNLKQPTVEQEQKLYAAFFLTVGDSLKEALIPLNCKTVGLESLADLLNPKKMFPNSYETLTVPIYNLTNVLPTVVTPPPLTPTTPVTPNGVTLDPTSWVFNNTSPAGDFSQLTSTTTNGYNVGAGRCTFEFNFKSENYFAQNPGGHFAVVVRCNNAAIANGYVQGQGIVIGNVSDTPTTTTPAQPPGVPFNPNPAHPSTQIESFWAGVATAPDGSNYYGNTLLPNTNGANPVLVDGVEYKFAVIVEVLSSGKSYTGYTITQGTNVVYQQQLVYDYNVWYDHTKSGIVMGHVYKNSSATAWSVTISNKIITWSPVGGNVVITPPPPEPQVVFPNSKVYYPIYVNGATNPNLTSPAVLNQIGAQTPVGTPQISSTTPSANITIQQPTIGFGSYLSTIVPPAQATACGAIAASFLQVKNITNVPVEKFGQVVTNIESIVGLPVNGTNVPTNLALRTAGRPLIALGSGPQGTYTASDFFGCMSGLPYNGPLKNIYNRLQEVATRKLFNIYHETYLAVTEQRAKMGIEQPYWYVITKPYVPPTPGPNPSNPGYQPDPDLPNYDPNEYSNPPYDSATYWVSPGSPEEYDWYYRITFQVAVPGGGYGRGTAPNPLVSISPNNVGASSVSNVGRDDNEIPGMFGRVTTSDNYGGSYLWAHTVQDNWAPTIYPATTPPHYPPKDDGWVRANMPEEIITIEAPPIQMLPVQANGNFATDGVNTPGFSVSYKRIVSQGTWWWPAGGAAPGMNTPITGYIGQANEEINYINSGSRASCQSLNDSWNATGTQLTIEQRARQNGLKPPLESTRQNYMSLYPTVIYNFVDGLAQYAKNTQPHMYAQTMENITDYTTPGGQSAVVSMRQQRNQERLTLLGIDLDNNIEDKLPYDQQKILIANGSLPTGVTNANIPSGSTVATTTTTTTTTGNTTTTTTTANTTTPTGNTTTSTASTVDSTGNVVIVTPIGTVDPITGIYYPTDPNYGGQVPPIPLDNGNAFIPTGGGTIGGGGTGTGGTGTGTGGTGTGTGGTGTGIGGTGTSGTGIGGIGTPGSFAGSPYTNLIPPELNSWYSSNTLYPSTYTVSQAIEEVILCNCDCWQIA